MGKIVKVINIILLILAVLCVFGIFSGPISSADFWWHLKSGQYIYQTRSLPATDPFSYTTDWDTPDPQTLRNQNFTLKQSWLAQIFMYSIYRLFSFEGIIYLRAALLTILILLLYRSIRREGIGLHASLFLVLPAVIIFAGFTPERPQLFSFLFFALMVFLLEGFRKKSLQSRRLKPAATLNFGDKSSLIQNDLLPTVYHLLPTVVVMFLWANIHGGFFLGIILLSSYFFAELIKYTAKRFGPSLPLKSLKMLGLTAVISSLCSLINPNGYNVFVVLMERRHGLYRYLISETISTIEHVRLGLFGPELIMFFLLLFLCLVFFFIHIRRMDLTDALTIILFTGLSLYVFRLIPFFTPLAVLFVARYRLRFSELPFGGAINRFCHSGRSDSSRSSASDLSGISLSFPPLSDDSSIVSPPLRGGERGEGVKSIGTPPPYPSPLKGEGDMKEPTLSKNGNQSPHWQIILSSLLSSILIFTLVQGNLFGGLISTNLLHRSEVVTGSKYPQGAVKFLKETRIAGNMFNPLDWGGYLMWYLFPDYKVFIDGRGLREDVVVEASKIMAAVKNDLGGMPEWKTYLEHYNVSMIITYSVEHFSGRLIPLLPALLNDPQWNLIYADEISLVFARETPENSDIIRNFQLPKEWIWHEVISEAQLKSRGFFSRQVQANFLITIGDAYLSTKNYEYAKAAYLRAWQTDPDNQMVRSRLQFLNSIFR